jgi:glutamate-ammonia-ligase adenylyltransferase
MADFPALLDELLDARLFDEPPSREELTLSLRRGLARIDAGDTEAYLDAIRQFQRAALFRIAAADRLANLPLMKVSDRLTDTAELVIDAALEFAWAEQTAKYGKPTHGEQTARRDSAFAVIAYGKLGGLELGYGSDLDLVFLHDSSGAEQQTTGPTVIDNQRFFTRLVQQLIHLLTIQTSSGRLYEIDTRLRPSGASGLLVASLASFRKYQREQAWTWEHQALLRSRSVAGSCQLCAAFEAERIDVLTKHVAVDTLAADVAKMRTRMFGELATGTRELFDLKQDRGGLADIEFLIDYLVLSQAREHPSLVRYPDNVRQLEAIAATGLAAPDVCADLKDAYLSLRADIHELSLNDAGRRLPAAGYAALRRRVIGFWNAFLGEDIVIG